MSKISNNVKYQLPEFIRNDYPVFVSFMEAYHKFVEQNETQIKIISDIDTVFGDFLENYKREINHIGMAFPHVDTKFILRHIKNLYLSKGTTESYVALFRILYNKEVFIKFPEEYTIKASDGRWIQKYSIFASTLTGDGSNLNDVIVKCRNPVTKVEIDLIVENYELRHIGGGVSTIQLKSGGTGYTAGATSISITGGGGSLASAEPVIVGGVIESIKITNTGDNYTVEPIVTIIGDGVGAEIDSTTLYLRPDIYEFTINRNFYGSISVDDMITYGDYSGRILPTINSFRIANGGQGFSLGQTFDIKTHFGTGATIKVTKVDTDTKAIREVKFIKFGYGYISDFSSLNIIPKPLLTSVPVSEFAPRLSQSNIQILSIDGQNFKVLNGGSLSNVASGHEVLNGIDNQFLGVVKNILAVNSVSTASWLAGVGTYTTTFDHNFEIGTEIEITEIDPIGYNGTLTVTGIVSPTVFTANIVADPGTYVSGGLITPITNFTLVTPCAANSYPAVIFDPDEILIGTVEESLDDQISSGYILRENYFQDADYAFDYAGTIAREFYSNNKYNGKVEKRATIEFKIGPICKYPGYYDSSNGKLSDDFKLQDSKFYQKYSLVIQSDLPIATYKESVNRYIHPAGVALFGEYAMSSRIDLNVKLIALLSAFNIFHADGVFADHGYEIFNDVPIEIYQVHKQINDVTNGLFAVNIDTSLPYTGYYSLNGAWIDINKIIKQVNDESSTALGINIDSITSLTGYVYSNETNAMIDINKIIKRVNDVASNALGIPTDTVLPYTGILELNGAWIDINTIIKHVNDIASNALGITRDIVYPATGKESLGGAMIDINSIIKHVNDTSNGLLGISLDRVNPSTGYYSLSGAWIDINSIVKHVNDASNGYLGIDIDVTTPYTGILELNGAWIDVNKITKQVNDIASNALGISTDTLLPYTGIYELNGAWIDVNYITKQVNDVASTALGISTDASSPYTGITQLNGAWIDVNYITKQVNDISSAALSIALDKSTPWTGYYSLNGAWIDINSINLVVNDESSTLLGITQNIINPTDTGYDILNQYTYNYWGDDYASPISATF